MRQVNEVITMEQELQRVLDDPGESKRVAAELLRAAALLWKCRPEFIEQLIVECKKQAAENDEDAQARDVCMEIVRALGRIQPALEKDLLKIAPDLNPYKEEE